MQAAQGGEPKITAPARRRGGRCSFFFAGVALGLPAACSLTVLAVLALAFGVNTFLSLGPPVAEDHPAQPAPAALAEPRATLAALATRVAVLSQAASARDAAAPIPAPSLPESSWLARPVPHPLAEYTIAGLRARTYPGGTLQARQVLTATEVYTRYYIAYPSDGLTITGIMQVPRGQGPFPVVILNHGYIPRERYWSGADTWSAAAYLNRRGYLTIAPDFRSWGGSDVGTSFFSTGQVIDALNLVSSLPSVPQANSQRVGMWGHSMGGGVTAKAIAIDSRIKAAVLYAPVSADDAEVLARWGSGCQPGPSGELAAGCAGAEVLTSDMDPRLYLAYTTAVSDPSFLYETSPIHSFDWVTAPVQIHAGTADTRTPSEWSAAIYQALDGAGVEVEYYAYAGAGHAFVGRDWELFMERVADFYDRNL